MSRKKFESGHVTLSNYKKAVRGRSYWNRHLSSFNREQSESIRKRSKRLPRFDTPNEFWFAPLRVSVAHTGAAKMPTPNCAITSTDAGNAVEIWWLWGSWKLEGVCLIHSKNASVDMVRSLSSPDLLLNVPRIDRGCLLECLKG